MKNSTAKWWILGTAVFFAAGVFALTQLPVNVPLTKLALPYGLNFDDEPKLLRRVILPPGFKLNIYATGLGKARLMALTPKGDILLSTPPAGEIKLIARDGNQDGRADGVSTLLSGLNRPHGLLLHDGFLYVAEENAVKRYPIDLSQPKITGKAQTIVENIPADGGHWTRTLGRGPDGWLYLTIGSSCNVCEEENSWRSAMLRFHPDGRDITLFATGLRNTVGFDWQPGTEALYGVDNSRDWLGDDFPPDELNKIEKGGFYGWPYRNGDNVPDPDFGDKKTDKTLMPRPPAFAFPAHVAPLSIRFLRHAARPVFDKAALVAFHGSWNRSKKIGYEVVSLHWDDHGAVTSEKFLSGFEKNGDVIGRPVDIVEAPDGTIYVTDDLAGAIYRITATQP